MPNSCGNVRHWQPLEHVQDRINFLPTFGSIPRISANSGYSTSYCLSFKSLHTKRKDPQENSFERQSFGFPRRPRNGARSLVCICTTSGEVKRGADVHIGRKYGVYPSQPKHMSSSVASLRRAASARMYTSYRTEPPFDYYRQHVDVRPGSLGLLSLSNRCLICFHCTSPISIQTIRSPSKIRM